MAPVTENPRAPLGLDCQWRSYQGVEKQVDINGDGTKDVFVKEWCKGEEARPSYAAYLRNPQGEELPLDRLDADVPSAVRFGFTERTLTQWHWRFRDWPERFPTRVQLPDGQVRQFSIGDDINVDMDISFSDPAGRPKRSFVYRLPPSDGGRIYGFAYDIDLTTGAAIAFHVWYVKDQEIEPTLPLLPIDRAIPTPLSAERLRDDVFAIMSELRIRHPDAVREVETAAQRNDPEPPAAAALLSRKAADLVRERGVTDRFGVALVHTDVMRRLGIYRQRWPVAR